MDWVIDPSWTLFLDRDGVINERNFEGYILNPKQFVFKKGSVEAIAEFTKMFKYIFIVTNQQCIGKGILTEKELKEIHSYMLSQIQIKGGKVTQIYFAPELKGKEMLKRKPLPKMAEMAKAEYPDVDFSKSIMIGDTDSDIMFGKNLGMKTVCIKSEETIIEQPTFFCDSLPDFINNYLI